VCVPSLYLVIFEMLIIFVASITPILTTIYLKKPVMLY